MKKLSSVLLFLSIFIVGCSNPENSSTDNSTSESSKIEKEKEVFKLYGAEYNLSAKTFSVSGKTNIDNKVVAKKDGEEFGEVRVTASGSIEYVGEIPEKSFDIEFSDKNNSETVTIKSLSELEQEERDKRIAIAKEERKKADEEAEKEAKVEQDKKEEEETNKKQAKNFLIENASREHKNALKKAEEYLNYTSFSKNGLYEQLIYEKFPDDSAQFAIDNIETDWNRQALNKAKDYLEYSSFSNEGLYDQLIYEGFTEEEARFAIDNLPK